MEFYTLDLYQNFDRGGHIPLYIEEVSKNHPENRLHSHTFTELTLIMRGEAQHILGGAAAPIKKGDVLVLLPGSTHAYNNTKDFALINLTYDYKKLSMPIIDGYEMPLFHRLFPSSAMNISDEEHCKPVLTLPDDKTEKLAEDIRDLQRELNDSSPGNFFVSLTKFMQIVAELARNSSFSGKHNQTMSKIGEIVFLLQQNPMAQISVEEMAKAAMMSKRNFFRAFQAVTGCPPQEYRMQLRLKMATELLLTTDLRINEIAFQCGYYDSNYFCNIFRRHFKLSPRQYRMKHIPDVR